MNITFSRRDMVAALNHIVRVTEIKSTMPILSHVLIESNGDKATLRASDLYIGITASVPVESKVSGAIALPAKPLLERVKVMPDGPISFVVAENQSASLKAAGSARKFLLRGMPAQDFPPLPKVEDAPTSKLSSAKLARLIERVRLAISTDETRPHLNSMLLEWEGTTLRAVSTDGHRLHKAESTTEGVGNLRMLIPLKGTNEVLKLLDGAEDVTIAQRGSSAFFTTGKELSVKLVDAQFPPYDQVIPKLSVHKTTVASRATREVVKAVMVSANDRTGALVANFSEGKMLALKAESPDGGEAEDEIGQDGWKGQDLRIGFSGKYLLDALESAGDVDVELGLSGDLDPMLVKTEGLVAVVMPCRS